jgi:hypothetical protein
MLYSEIIAVCSQIHTKHINTLCGQNVARSKHTPFRLQNQWVNAVHWNNRLDKQRTANHNYNLDKILPWSVPHVWA